MDNHRGEAREALQAAAADRQKARRLSGEPLADTYRDISMSLIDGTQLASALAERLAQVLPEGFSISSDGPDLWLDTPDGVGTSAWAGVVDQNPRDLSLYTSAAWTVLSSIQDGVSVTLRELWPLVMVGSEHQMATPGAKVVDGALELWYGNEDAPAIRLQPIKLRN